MSDKKLEKMFDKYYTQSQVDGFDPLAAYEIAVRAVEYETGERYEDEDLYYSIASRA